MKKPYVLVVSGIGLGSGEYDGGRSLRSALESVAYFLDRGARVTLRLPGTGAKLHFAEPALVAASGVAS